MVSKLSYFVSNKWTRFARITSPNHSSFLYFFFAQVDKMKYFWIINFDVWICQNSFTFSFLNLTCHFSHSLLTYLNFKNFNEARVGDIFQWRRVIERKMPCVCDENGFPFRKLDCLTWKYKIFFFLHADRLQFQEWFLIQL